MNRTDFRHVTPVTVHWGDMDALGHVNNVIFFRYVESGRISYFNELAGDDPSISTIMRSLASITPSLK